MCNQVNGASVIPTLPPVRLFKHCVGKRVKTIFLMEYWNSRWNIFLIHVDIDHQGFIFQTESYVMITEERHEPGKHDPSVLQ